MAQALTDPVRCTFSNPETGNAVAIEIHVFDDEMLSLLTALHLPLDHPVLALAIAESRGGVVGRA